MSRERLNDDEPEREERAPEPARGYPSQDAILRLQQTAGNAAVARAMIQRNGPAVAAKTPDQECEDALKAEDWAKVAKLLSDNRPGIVDWMMSVLWTPWVQAKLAKMTPDQLRYLDDAARRSKLADTWLRTAVTAQLAAKGVGAKQAAPGMGYGTVEGKQTVCEDGDTAANPKKNFRYRFEITFAPTGAAVDADEIAFIQTARIVSTKTGANESPYGKERMTADNTKVDRLSGKEQGWYGMDDAGGGGTTLTPWKKGNADPAWMRDTPSAARGDRDYTFETSVVCHKGKDAGKVYAVVVWGFTVDDKLKVTAKKHEIFNKPSPAFEEAVEAWNTQAAGPEAKRNAPGQKPLPDVT